LGGLKIERWRGLASILIVPHSPWGEIMILIDRQQPLDLPEVTALFQHFKYETASLLYALGETAPVRWFTG
jgi:hypothetical protein